ncbi:MAG: hypothetical protein AAFW81_08005 [Pseudomonadota bacterium]
MAERQASSLIAGMGLRRSAAGGGMARAIVLGVLLALAISSALRADEFKLRVQESEDLRLLYIDPFFTPLTPHATRVYYNALAFQKETFNWEPWEKTTTLMLDISDYGNGAAFSSPSNGVHLQIAPVSQTFEAFIASDRIYSLLNHELVHIAALDAWNERDAFWRRAFFGKPLPEREHPVTILYNFLATPRVNAPRWYHEGSAVFFETWMAAGRGRAEGAYDEMVFRSMVRDDAHFYGPLGLVSKGTESDFRGLANAYLYGTRFFSYLTLAYSPEHVVEWLSRGEDSKAYYSSQFKYVFGRPIAEVWSEWIEWERTFQQRNLEAVRAAPLTPAERLSPRALGSISRAFYVEDRDSLIAAFRYPGVVEHLGELDVQSGQIARLADIKGSMPHRVSSVAYDEATDTAWFTTDNYQHRDVVQVNVATGKKKKILKDARIGDLVFNPVDRSLWGVRHRNGKLALMKMAPPYDDPEVVYVADYRRSFFDLDISRDGALLAMTVGAVNGRQSLQIFRIADLEGGDFKPISVIKQKYGQPEGAAFSHDGRFVYFSSYESGVSNIYRATIDGAEVAPVTNTDTGYVRPIPRADGSLIAFEFTGAGFAPVNIDPAPVEELPGIFFLGNTIAQKYDLRRRWSVGSPVKNVDLDAIERTEGDYRPRRNLRLGSIYPVIEGYQDSVAFGVHVNIEDPAYFNRIDVTLSYSAGGDLGQGERFHADVRYQGLYWRGRYWHNDADFYDLFGPTERAREGDAFIIGYERALIYDDPRELSVDFEVGYYTGLDTLPGNQNVASGFSEIFEAAANLSYTNTKDSLGSVDHEKGWRWEVAKVFDRAGGDSVGRVRGGIDFGFALPIPNSSVWFYNSGGISYGNSLNPLASFYFGGFKNNYVDDREVKRYREYHTVPGFEIDEIAARDFVKSVAEWNLPPYRIESVGTPELYLANLRSAIFAGALIANPGAAAERTVYSVGFQVDLNFTLAHRLPMTLSVGYASGFEDGSDRSDEFMLSLKVM